MPDGTPGPGPEDLKPQQKTYTRRYIGKKIGQSLAVLVGVSVLEPVIGKFIPKKEYTLPVPEDVSESDISVGDPAEDPREKETKWITSKLNEIKDRELMDPERMKREAAYVASANSLERIDKGFWTLGRKVNRAGLLKKRFDLRQRGHAELQKLSPELVEWANKRGIHPESVGICIDAYQDAKVAIESLKTFHS